MNLRRWGTTLLELFPPSRIPDNALRPDRAVVRRKITLYHNFFRTKVQPTAANMLLMSWHPAAAHQAQRYAEKCRFLEHNNPQENQVYPLGTCGQNLFVAAQKTPWFFAVKSWFMEYQNFTYGVPIHNFHEVGHYTQVVWATSHKVGCGIAHCLGGPWGQFYNYVCHYCPAGNVQPRMEFPYKPGRPCADCPDHCIGGALCTNPCSEVDIYSNCGQLSQMPGVCGMGFCNATCTCGRSRVHKNYPWAVLVTERNWLPNIQG
ncbi:serotriflin-like [Pectinophora gossypiella]|uniref:serotriflin-like n=1 Tax=Pectinophora gossypiella TaxID=13191 RepID=UPI00214F612E|nr:serotriflin-like [Pectinophora gossypiella]